MAAARPRTTATLVVANLPLLLIWREAKLSLLSLTMGTNDEACGMRMYYVVHDLCIRIHFFSETLVGI